MRKVRPLLFADPLPALDEGFEALIVEAALEGDGGAGRDCCVERHRCVLLAIDPTDAQRRHLRARSVLLATAKSTLVKTRVELERACERAWPQIDADFCVSVIATAPRNSNTWQTLLHSLSQIVIGDTAEERVLLVVIAEDCGSWCGLDGFRFVKAQNHQRTRTAEWVMDAACALLAPVHLAPFDLDDLKGCFGSAAAPSRLDLTGRATGEGATRLTRPATPTSARIVSMVQACTIDELMQQMSSVRRLHRDSPDLEIVGVAASGLV